MKEGNLSRISVSEGLIPNIESSFLWLANIEVSHNHTNGVRVRWPLKGVKKLVLPMNFLKADDVVASSKSTEVVLLPFPGSL